MSHMVAPPARAIGLALVATLVLVLAVACDGDGSVSGRDDAGTTTPERPTGQAAGEPTGDGMAEDPGDSRIEPAELPDELRESIQSFRRDVQSLQTSLEFASTSGDFSFDGVADTVYETPDHIYSDMNFSELGSAKILVLGSEIYLNYLDTGWVAAAEDDLQELGLEAATYEALMANPGLFDYEALVMSLGASPTSELTLEDLDDLISNTEDFEDFESLRELLGGQVGEGTPDPDEEAEEGGIVEDLGEENVDGDIYRHFRGGLDFADWLAAYDDPSGAEELLFTPGTAGVLTFDIWVDPDTLRPRKLAGSGDLSDQSFQMTFDFSLTLAYNEPVNIPGAPEDAMTVSEYLSD